MAHEHDKGHDACGCGHGHDDDTCGCGHGHEHDACGCDHDHDEAVEPRELVLMGISGAAIAAGFVLERLVRNEGAANVAFVIAAVAGLVFVAPASLRAIRDRRADMNVLMGTAVAGALVMGFTGDSSVFSDAAIVIFLDQIGEWLEGWAMRRTRGSIKDLLELAPDTAHLVGEGGSLLDVDVCELSCGQAIRVLPGERVPLDGRILSGSTALDEAAITGESVPADKAAGDDVYAGSLNTSGVIDVEVTSDESTSTLARIVEMVEGAQAQRAPYESFVNRFAARYTPIVMVGALILGIAVPTVIGLARGFTAGLWHDWAYRALSLLVVACPCALVVSTPVTFVSAITRAARDGVLVKGGACFDIASGVDSVLLDKTGTLTMGRPAVTGIVTLNGATEQDVLAIARALEAGSTHPIARAIVEEADSRRIPLAEAADVVEVGSAGMTGSIAGVACTAGKAHLAGGAAAEAEEAAERFGEQGATAVVVSAGGRIAGVIGVADSARLEARAAVEALLGLPQVRLVEMLTGDNARSAAHVAAGVGISTFTPGLLPEGKAQRVAELKGQGSRVAMVGDGVNDAPALATADLGVTMSAASSDTALEVADVALLSDDLSQLPAFLSLATRAMHIVRENIAFAIGVKVLVFCLVIAGMAGMGAAVFADTGVLLIVILNGMRLLLDSRLPW